tara:strand:- start:169 stop:438 length:270 start_codon:yes stop_codon:yes gene_type:complete
LGKNFLNVGIKFINKTNKEIDTKAIKAVLTKSLLIPALSSKPMTLKGIPNLINGIEIISDALGLYFPIIIPKIRNGIIFINNVEIVFNL